jgi:hypothetical protein
LKDIDEVESELEDAKEPAEPRSRRSIAGNLDILAAILLSFATVATAWCAYQSSVWASEQSKAYAQASSLRIQSTREFDRAYQILSIDVDLFTEWVAAYAAGNEDIQNFYETNLFRPEFVPYLEDWLASEPLNNPDALPHPFADSSYFEMMTAEGDNLLSQAETRFDEAVRASDKSDAFVLATVLFATVLFFGGISTKFMAPRIQGVLIGMAVLMLVLGILQTIGLMTDRI